MCRGFLPSTYIRWPILLPWQTAAGSAPGLCQMDHRWRGRTQTAEASSRQFSGSAYWGTLPLWWSRQNPPPTHENKRTRLIRIEEEHQNPVWVIDPEFEGLSAPNTSQQLWDRILQLWKVITMAMIILHQLQAESGSTFLPSDTLLFCPVVDIKYWSSYSLICL